MRDPIREPIIKFEDTNHAIETMKWWQEKLYLNDWILHLKILPFSEPPLNSLYMGRSEADHVNNCAMIFLAEQSTLPQDCLMTLCDEKVLVHELLHLVYPSFVNEEEFTSAYMDTEEHRKLEKMAKTLIAVKYRLPREWFSRHWHDRFVEEVKEQIRKELENVPTFPRREEVAQTE